MVITCNSFLRWFYNFNFCNISRFPILIVAVLQYRIFSLGLTINNLAYCFFSPSLNQAYKLIRQEILWLQSYINYLKRFSQSKQIFKYLFSLMCAYNSHQKDTVTIEKPEIQLIPKIKITFFPSPWKPSVLQQWPSELK